MLWIWTQFLICLGIILVAGWALSLYGDAIAEKSGLGRTWIGVILMATVTSLPELFSGISAVAITHLPDMAIGSLLGSCVFNLALIVPVDFISRGKSIYTVAGQGHILSAALGLSFIGFVTFILLIASQVEAFSQISLWSVSVTSPLIIIFYLAAMRTLYRHEQRQSAGAPPADEKLIYGHLTPGTVYGRFGVAAAIVVAAAMWLPSIGEKMGEAMGWNESFIGTLFIAFATSAPEMVVTISAVRMGALDLAIGNVLGSNLFNMAEVGVLDAFYREGPLLSAVTPAHATTAFAAVIMSGLVIVGLFYRPGRRVLRTVGWISIFMLFLFLLNSFVIYISQ